MLTEKETRRLAQDTGYPAIIAAPAEWLEEAYRGRRVVSDEGFVLFVNDKACMFVTLEVQYLSLPGKGGCKIVAPEFHIADKAQIELVTKVGAFVVFRGVVPDDVLVVDNPPEPEGKAITDKAQAALEKLGLTGDVDDF